MSDMLQNVLAVTVCLAAAAYIAWRAWRALSHRKAGCGACGTCPSSASPQPAGRKTLVAIESPPGPPK